MACCCSAGCGVIDWDAACVCVSYECLYALVAHISWKRDWVNECDCSDRVFEQWLCVREAQRLRRNFGRKTTCWMCFLARILSFNPSQNQSLRVKFSKCDLWPQLYPSTANWFLPGVLCASKYWSHPWFCEITSLFWFLQSSGTFQEVEPHRGSHIIASLLLLSLSTNGHDTAHWVSSISETVLFSKQPSVHLEVCKKNLIRPKSQVQNRWEKMRVSF